MDASTFAISERCGRTISKAKPQRRTRREREMYCPSCGVAVAPGLSYCNHCGAKLNTDDKVVKSAEVRPALFVNAMVVTFIFGLLAIAVLAGVMKSVLGLDVGQILALMLLSFLLMFVLE